MGLAAEGNGGDLLAFVTELAADQEEPRRVVGLYLQSTLQACLSGRHLRLGSWCAVISGRQSTSIRWDRDERVVQVESEVAVLDLARRTSAGPRDITNWFSRLRDERAGHRRLRRRLLNGTTYFLTGSRARRLLVKTPVSICFDTR